MNRNNFPMKTALIFLFIAINASCNVTPENSNQQILNYISIRNDAFNPASVTVPVNTVVYWTNNDPYQQQVSSIIGSPQNFGTNLQPGQGYSFQFTKTGTDCYNNPGKPDMSGVVIVTN